MGRPAGRDREQMDELGCRVESEWKNGYLLMDGLGVRDRQAARWTGLLR